MHSNIASPARTGSRLIYMANYLVINVSKNTQLKEPQAKSESNNFELMYFLKLKAYYCIIKTVGSHSYINLLKMKLVACDISTHLPAIEDRFEPGCVDTLSAESLVVW